MYYWAETLRALIWVLLALLLFTPMIVEFVFVSDILPTAQRLFSFWKGKTASVFLSDILFMEAGSLVLFGVIIAVATLFSAWAALDAGQVMFTEYIWHWRQKDRDSPAGLIFGLILLAVGFVFVLVAVFAPLGMR
jgi:hypothetical protein